MTCVKEKRDTEMTRQESLQGTGSKRKIRMVSWRFLLELSSGWQPRPDGQGFWTYSKNCPWLRVKEELRAPKSSYPPGFSSACSWVSCLKLSDASGPDLPGVPHSSQLWRTELVHATPDLQTQLVPAPRAQWCPTSIPISLNRAPTV